MKQYKVHDNKFNRNNNNTLLLKLDKIAIEIIYVM